MVISRGEYSGQGAQRSTSMEDGNKTMIVEAKRIFRFE